MSVAIFWAVLAIYCTVGFALLIRAYLTAQPDPYDDPKYDPSCIRRRK
jgi:hypothetical protein